jgi:hypothetical protein
MLAARRHAVAMLFKCDVETIQIAVRTVRDFQNGESTIRRGLTASNVKPFDSHIASELRRRRSFWLEAVELNKAIHT